MYDYPLITKYSEWKNSFRTKWFQPMLGKLFKVCFISFIVLVIVGAFIDGTGTSFSTSTTSTKTYPVNSESYQQVNSAVGCESKFSDDKKDDIFASAYKNHWMTWTGEVLLAEADEASLNIDRVGTQDLQVDFKDSNAGYDLIIGDTITVKFLMKRIGGCFLPFSGDDAIIL